MILANSKEHFAFLAFKLRLYMQLLESNFNEGVKIMFLTKLGDRKWSDLVKYEELHIIDEKAKEDQQESHQKIRDLLSSRISCH